ncbi:MAG: triose-phosphate isomerase [Candidatus Hodarchaeota archaeon]
MVKRKYVVGGNWKMHKTIEECGIFLREFVELVEDYIEKVDIVISPSFIALNHAVNILNGKNIHISAQNMYFEEKGAFTGEISPSMVLDSGATFVILGHSERRKIFGETSNLISKKLATAHEYELKPIVCIGETREEREKGLMEKVLKDQLIQSLATIDKEKMKSTIIAYEPVWAIGTGLTATPQQAQQAHEYVRSVLREIFDDATGDEVRIQYGGSIKPKNSQDLFSQPDIDGGLVGGASLDPKLFAEIIKSVPL